jgi:hypothetical protein
MQYSCAQSYSDSYDDVCCSVLLDTTFAIRRFGKELLLEYFSFR